VEWHRLSTDVALCPRAILSTPDNYMYRSGIELELLRSESDRPEPRRTEDQIVISK